MHPESTTPRRCKSTFHRAANGALAPAGTFPTGGAGTGAGLGSGHSLVVSKDGRALVVVNAGSSTVSAFKVNHDGLRLIGGPVASGGTRPTSLTLDGDLLYVMNADSNSIAGFRLDDKRGLTPIAGSIQQFGAGTSVPSQIQFDKSRRVLIVDECVGRAKTNSHFGGSRTAISAQVVHRFRTKPNADFG
jgi:6-phosphogluconolactonase